MRLASFILVFLFCSGCLGKSDSFQIRGLVVDKNNNPVKAIIYKIEFKNGMEHKGTTIAVCNKSGEFVTSKLKTGVHNVSIRFNYIVKNKAYGVLLKCFDELKVNADVNMGKIVVDLQNSLKEFRERYIRDIGVDPFEE